MDNSVNIKIKCLHPDVILPRRQTEGSAGYDICASLENGQDLIIPSKELGMIPTGIAVEIPVGYQIEIRPRSGISTKFLVLIPNSPGTIDSDYRGMIYVPMLNLGTESFVVKHKMRIAQLLVQKIYTIDWSIVSELDDGGLRGSRGFGSTGFEE